MVIAQTQKAEELHVALPSSPSIPPTGDVCFINDLPPELLSRIFEVSSVDRRTEYQSDVINGDSDILWQHLHAWKRPAENDTRESGIEIKELADEDEDEDEADEDESGDKGEDEADEDEEEGEETDDKGDSDETVSSDPPPPWLPSSVDASHVCRQWRNVAFSTPSLWTTMVITPVAHRPSKPKPTLLERSKSLPIDVYVCCQHHRYENDTEPPSDVDLKSVFSTLTPHVDRWRTMHVTVFGYRLMHVFLSAVSSPSISLAPQLTTLELYHYAETGFLSFGNPSMSKYPTLFGGSAPLLTRIVLWGVYIDWNQPWIASALNLTDLQLAFHPEDVRPSWAQFVTVLRGASSLEKLSLCQSGPSRDPAEWFIEPTTGSPADVNGPVQLHRVTELVLAFLSPARAIGLLHKFYLPALKNLVLDFYRGDYTDFVHELAGPATSLSPAEEHPRSLLSRLEILKIAGLPCLIDCGQMLCDELHNLVSLDIASACCPSPFLLVLSTRYTLTGEGDVQLPRLETLYVTRATGFYLRDIVQRRREAGVPLSALYVEKRCEVSKEDVKWLKENVKAFSFCKRY